MGLRPYPPLQIESRAMFFSPKAWLVLVGLFTAFLGLFYNYETNVTGLNYLSSDDAQIRSNLALRASQYVALEMSLQAPLSEGRPAVVIANVVDDYQGIVTSHLKKWLGRRNIRVLNNESWFLFSNISSSRPETVDEAIAPFLDDSADYIIAADVENWTTYPEYQAKLVGWVYLFNRDGDEILKMPLSPGNAGIYADGLGLADLKTQPEASKSELQGKTLATEGPNGHDNIQPLVTRNDRSSVGLKEANKATLYSSWLPMMHLGVLGWLSFVVLTPWGLQRPIKRILHRGDNKANAQMLLLWGLCCTVAIWLIITLGGISVMTTIVSLTAGFASCCYFAFVCGKLDRYL